MSFYVVLKRDMWEGFLSGSKASNPSRSALEKNITCYTQLHLFTSLDDAKKIADQFFSPVIPLKHLDVTE